MNPQNTPIPATQPGSPASSQAPAATAPQPARSPSAGKVVSGIHYRAPKESVDACVVRDLKIPAALAVITETARSSGARVAMDEFLAEAGGSKDPLERILLQQVLLAHHRIADLHARAAEAKNLIVAKECSAAAARLTGELRRLILSIRVYRQPPAQRSFSVITQQNVVASGSQEVQYVDQASEKRILTAKDKVDNKTEDLGDPISRRIHGDEQLQRLDEEESIEGAGRPDELAVAAEVER